MRDFEVGNECENSWQEHFVVRAKIQSIINYCSGKHAIWLWFCFTIIDSWNQLQTTAQSKGKPWEWRRYCEVFYGVSPMHVSLLRWGQTELAVTDLPTNQVYTQKNMTPWRRWWMTCRTNPVGYTTCGFFFAFLDCIVVQPTRRIRKNAC